MKGGRPRPADPGRLLAMARLAADADAARARAAAARLAGLRARRDGVDAALRAGMAEDATLTVARYALWTTLARADLNRAMLPAMAEAEAAARTAAHSEARAGVLDRLARRGGTQRR